MSVKLRISLVVLALVFFVTVVHLVRHGRLQLKYSFLWLAIGLSFLLAAVFPDIVTFLKELLGVGLTSNFVFLAAFAGLFAVTLSLTVIVSWQARDIRSLIQHVALLEKEIQDEDRREEAHSADALNECER